ncbi:MAG: transcription antitermination factor NusB [Lentisphaerae bacterium]|nr:transcription antitermination factor NusB [Lentisphaerota bacterium]
MVTANRRQAREWVVQLLFQLDMNPAEDLEMRLTRFWEETPSTANAREFAERLVRGVLEKRESIDTVIQNLAEHWEIGRMGVIDRSVLRMAMYEIMFCDDIPAVVSINEAVDIAKYFSNTESGRFVNGILDKARKDFDVSQQTQ